MYILYLKLSVTRVQLRTLAEPAKNLAICQIKYPHAWVQIPFGGGYGMDPWHPWEYPCQCLGLIIWVFWINGIPVSNVEFAAMFVCGSVLFSGAEDLSGVIELKEVPVVVDEL